MVIRTCICIPTYNNKESIAKVVLDCLEQTSFPVLVVDDGSDVPVRALLADEASQRALASGRLRVERFGRNRGKGAALAHAFGVCTRDGFTHLAAIDGDGQHLVSELAKLIEAAREHPWDLIIGNRKLSGDTIPRSTTFGRSFSNFWVGFQTGTTISDSQSGFRLYPLFRVQNMRFWTRRYDFEIEVLIRLLWRGVAVREVEIGVYYPPASKRVSHFDKLWDNVRISCLNTVLVTLSLLKSPRSPAATGLALGLGVLVGCTPFFGLHTLIVTALALALRLNVVLLVLGSQISIPPLAPFLALASIRIGHLLAGGGATSSPITTLTTAAAEYSHWVLGSLILGAGLGGTVGIVSAFAASALRAKAGPKRNWSGKTRGGRLGNWILKNIARHLGLRAAYFCLYFIIPYFYLFAPKARKAAQEYWLVRRPDAAFFTRQWLVCRQLFEFGRLLLDRVFQGFSETPCFQARSNGLENILANAANPQGLILLTSHMGGWDMATSALPSQGFAGELHLLQYEAAGLTLSKVADHKGRGHVRSLDSAARGQPILQIRELLSRGKPVAIMGDRPVASHFELVSFFGKLAPFDTTPFRIAAACQAPLIFTFGFKAEGKAYDLYAEPVRTYAYAPGEDKTLKCIEWAQEFAHAIEHYLERYPEQWSNFFPFWSALPAPPEGVEATRVRNNLVEELRKQPRLAPGLAAGSNATDAPALQP